MTPGRCSRAAHAAMFAAVCVLLAAVGHVLMSARAVSAGTLACAFAGTAVGAWALAGRERGLVTVTAAAMVFQTALHTLFSWSQSAASAPAGGSGGPVHRATAHLHPAHAAADHMGMAHAVVPEAPPVSAVPVAHDMAAMSSSMSGSMAGMMAAHLLAALLSGVWLAYGERAAFRLLRAVPAVLFRPLRLLLATVAAPSVRPRVRPARPGDEPAPRQLVHASRTLPTRGPPRAIAVI